MNETLKNCQKKMYFNLTDEETQACLEALAKRQAEFEEINSNFPKLVEVAPMTHTITIDEVILREDVPVASPSVEELFKNASHVNGREIEVPKVVE